MSRRMKKILILGGSPNQLRLVEAARKSGIYTVVSNRSEDCAARHACDMFYALDYMNRERMLEIARQEEVDGVISNSEAAMLVVAYVSEKLGLPGNSIRGIEQLVSKAEFRKLQKACGIYSPNNFECSSWEELVQRIGSLRFPVIIKPSESSGTRGTTRIDDEGDVTALRHAFTECMHYSVNNMVSAEEFVEMPTLRVIDGDVFVCGGEFLWSGFFTCFRSKHAPMLPMMESFPILIGDEDFLIVKNQLKRLFSRAGIKHGQYNVEMYFTSQKELFIIEINARQGGNNIPHLIELHSSMDFDRLLVTTAVGDNTYFNRLKNMEYSQRYITQYVVFGRKSGVLKEIEIGNVLTPYLIERTDLKQPGDHVEVGENAGDAISLLVFDFGNAQNQMLYLETIENLIHPIIVTAHGQEK